MDSLTPKQELFVSYYTENAGETIKLMREDGHRISTSAGYKYMNDPIVMNAIKAKFGEDPEVKRNIKTAAELQEWWSGLLDNPEVTMGDKLNASEKLGKSMAIFVERSENTNIEELSLVSIVKEAEAIEVQEDEERKLLS